MEKENKNKPTVKRVLDVISNVIINIIITVGFIFLVLYLFGIKPYVVVSGSMEPSLKTGSLCFISVKHTYDDIVEGNIVAFKADDDKLVSHRAISITNEGIETKGDANDVTDGITVTRDNYYGKTLFSIPYIGYFVSALQTIYGKIILFVIVVLCIVNGFFKKEEINEDTNNNVKIEEDKVE